MKVRPGEYYSADGKHLDRRDAPVHEDPWEVISELRWEMNVRALRRQHYRESIITLLWTIFFLISASYFGLTDFISSSLQLVLLN